MLTKRTLIVILLLLSASILFVAAIPSASAHDDDRDDEAPLTYWHDIKPILDANCTGCHVEGEIAGLYPLDTYEDVTFAAPVMGDSIITGYMPPWPPGGATPALHDDRSLSDDEVDTLLRWLFTLEEGDPSEYEHATVSMETAREVRPDLTLEMPVDYMPDDSMLDDYRCFLIDPELDQDMMVTGYDIIPGSPSVVHHVLLFKVPGSAAEDAARLESEDENPGWTCFGGPRVSTAGGGGLRGLNQTASIAGSIGAWAPGTPATFFPPSTGDLLREDNLVVMQVHYNLEAGAVPDRTSAVLQLEPATDDLMALGAVNLTAPVEIPCPEGADSELCDRDQSIRSQVEAEGPRAALRADGLLAICDKSLAHYANQTAEAATSDCVREVPVDGFAVAAASHMHELGTRITLELNAGRDDGQMLLDIPEWDFHWQGAYQFVNPIPVEAGDDITITCTWDNSEGDRYIVWGEGTGDEMCLGGVTILPLPDGMTHDEFIAAHPEIFQRGEAEMAMHDHAHGDHAMADHSMDHHHDMMVAVSAEDAPTLALRTLDDGAGGTILLLDVTDFTFAPENVDGAHVPGEGHAHLYINGEKAGRIYGTTYLLEPLDSGEHEIMVTLNTNDHGTYAVDGEAIMASLTLTVE